MADLVDAAEELKSLKEKDPESYKRYLEDRRCSLLMEVDSIDRLLDTQPTHSEMKRVGRMVLRKAKKNPYLARELGLPSH